VRQKKAIVLIKTLHVSIYCNIHITALSNVRENQRGNQEWTIHRHLQHWIHKTQNEDKQSKKHNTEN